MTLKFNEEFAINPQSVESGGGGGGGQKLKYTVVIEEKINPVNVQIESEGE